jgi:hypothetical protein
VLKYEQNVTIDLNFEYQMSLSKRKCWYFDNCLHFLKCGVPLSLKHYWASDSPSHKCWTIARYYTSLFQYFIPKIFYMVRPWKLLEKWRRLVSTFFCRFFASSSSLTQSAFSRSKSWLCAVKHTDGLSNTDCALVHSLWAWLGYPRMG